MDYETDEEYIALPSNPTGENNATLNDCPLRSSASQQETTLINEAFRNLRPLKRTKQHQYTHVTISKEQATKDAGSTVYHKYNDGSNSQPLNDSKDVSSASSTPSTKTTKQPSIQWSHVKEQVQFIVRLGLPYFQESQQGRWLVATLLFLSLLNNGMSIFFSYVNRDFWSALAKQNAPQFYSVMVLYFATMLFVMAPINAWYTYQRDQLVLHWRSWLTRRTLKLYTSNQVYYQMEMERHQMSDSNDKVGESLDRTWMDNPDQRITEDVKAFTDLSVALSFELFGSIIQVGSFSAILWTIDPHLLGMAWIYAMGGTIVTTMLGHPLVHLNVEHLRREADLRCTLLRFREHAEAIAFYLRGALLEHDYMANLLQKVVTNQYRINIINRTMNLFTYTYSLSLDIIPVILVAPQYFAGKIELGVINQSTGSFAAVVASLSAIVYSFGTISEYAANVERLSHFYQAMTDVDAMKQTACSASERNLNFLSVAMDSSPPPLSKMLLLNQKEIDIEMSTTNRSTVDCSSDEQHVCIIYLQRRSHATTETSDRTILQLDHLHLVTPDQKCILVHDLNVTVTAGQHLLIGGASGVGKSSLLRAIAGLWTTGYGRITRPADDDVFFLPQQPYCTSGSLRDQLLYPNLSPIVTEHVDDNVDWSEETIPTFESNSPPLISNVADEELIRILEQINLLEIASRAGDGDPIKGLNVVMDWSHVLSLGERQRLAFGRLLLNRPKRLVVLDEATSALDLHNEKCMYRLLQEIAADTASPAMTYISVGHRPSLVEFHTMRLELGQSIRYD